MHKARILTMPALPGASRPRRAHSSDPRFVEGQRLLAEAIRYLIQSDPVGNISAVELLSEHFRTRFRITDSPQLLQPKA